jgi:hypothetical protein
MLVSCLLPTFNRYPTLSYLLEEAVECFLRQNYANKELIICNDTPGQTLRFNHPQVRVINAAQRFPTLGEKLDWMLRQAQGDYICRWDDDDLSLPWRLSHSVSRLFGQFIRPGKTWEWTPPSKQPDLAEWRPENHWYDPKGGQMTETKHPGNTHIMSIWHRRLILGVGMNYPGKACPSGEEDQTFNQHIWSLGYPRHGDLLPLEDIFYIYRWGTGSKHLSGRGGGQIMQESYEKLAEDTTYCGEWEINPAGSMTTSLRCKIQLGYYGNPPISQHWPRVIGPPPTPSHAGRPSH